MISNYLLNFDENGVIAVCPKLENSLGDDIIVLSGLHLAASLCEWSLAVTYDHLCNIAKIRSTFTQNDAEKLIHAFVTSRLDYCTSS